MSGLKFAISSRDSSAKSTVRVDALLRIGVVAEDERAVDADVARVQRADDVAIGAADVVPRFVHLLEALRIERFEADEHEPAAGGGHAVEQRLVARDVDTDLARPAALQRRHRVEQRKKVRFAAEEIVVDEEQQASWRQRLDFRDEAIERPRAQRRAVETMDGAEVAREAAAASPLHELDRRVVLAFVNGAVDAVIGERRIVAAGVFVLKPAGLEVGKQPLPRPFGVADDDGIGVLQAPRQAGRSGDSRP